MDESDEGMFVVDLRLEDMAIEVTCSKVFKLGFSSTLLVYECSAKDND